MERSSTVKNLQELLTNPINVGSIYVKPSEDHKSCCNRCFGYVWFICCWGCYD